MEDKIHKHIKIVDYLSLLTKDQIKNDPITRINANLRIMALNHRFYQG